MNWIIDNKEWIFSGIGVFIIAFFINFLLIKKKVKRNIMNQKSGSNSTNIQVGRDFHKK